MIKTMKIILPLILIAIFLSGPVFAFAQSPVTIKLDNPLGSTSTPTELLESVLDFLLKLGGVIAAIMIIIGAFQMLFAAGDPEKFITGRRTIVYTAIAYGILLMARGIVLIIKDFLT